MIIQCNTCSYRWYYVVTMLTEDYSSMDEMFLLHRDQLKEDTCGLIEECIMFSYRINRLEVIQYSSIVGSGG